MKPLNYIRVVLVEPTHPGNIGAVARAMANMGITQLAIVRPKEFPSAVANARAAGADWILDNAGIYNDLDEAISDCSLVIGTTARLRSIQWPSLLPWEAMDKAGVHAQHGQVAILFGRESSGLTNQELDRCHHLVRIPVEKRFESLNLGSAVMVMLYELRKTMLTHVAPVDTREQEPLATAQDMLGFYEQMHEVLTKIEFFDGRSTKLMRKIMRLFNRIEPYAQEVNMLRGILTAIEFQIESRIEHQAEIQVDSLDSKSADLSGADD